MATNWTDRPVANPGTTWSDRPDSDPGSTWDARASDPGTSWTEAWDEDSPPYYTFWFSRPDSTPTVLRRNWDWRPTREHSDRLALDWETQRLTWRTTGDWTDWVTEEMKEGGTPGLPQIFLNDDRSSVNLDGTTEILRDTAGTTLVPASPGNKFSIAMWYRWTWGFSILNGRLFQIYTKTPVVGKLGVVELFFSAGRSLATLIVDDGAGTYPRKEYKYPAADWLEIPFGTNWFHIVITFDGTAVGDLAAQGDLNLYLNGAYVEPSNRPYNFDFNPTSAATDMDFALSGTVLYASLTANYWYEFATWTSVLSATEVAGLYNNKLPIDPSKDSPGVGYTSSSTLFHWHRLGYDTGDIGVDYKGTLLDFMNNAVNIDASDVENVWPGE